MQAILLAGGLGTRLRSVVSDRPKPMALIGEKPFMEYVVHELSRHGITDIIFAVGYKGSMVEEYFGDGSGFIAPDGTPITVHYAYEEELLGTAGAIKNAGRFVTEDSFFVLNADTFYQIDYSRLVTMQRESDLDMALVLREVPDISRYGAAVLMNGRLTGFNEKCAGGGDGEAQPLGRAVVCHDLDGGHPHHLAPVIEQGAPGAAIVDGCAGLEEVHGGPFH